MNDTVTNGFSVEEAEATANHELAKEHEVTLQAALQRQEQEEKEEKERQQREAAARKLEAQRKAKESALAAEAERKKRKAAVRVSSPPTFVLVYLVWIIFNQSFLGHVIFRLVLHRALIPKFHLMQHVSSFFISTLTFISIHPQGLYQIPRRLGSGTIEVANFVSKQLSWVSTMESFVCTKSTASL